MNASSILNLKKQNAHQNGMMGPVKILPIFALLSRPYSIKKAESAAHGNNHPPL
jgi:hypothetical protein